ncbi:MAG: hypothetical protein DHS20C21_07580 [Gemmatimonadota bacterium]|nr:MAG: hypothetical protein DHS20C21_07580 [Gemmatimonadota bacterium]
MNARHRNLGSHWLALAALALLVLVLSSCQENTRGAFLLPTGGPGEAYVSRFSVLQVVGDFNNWDTTIPSMEVDFGGTWRDTLTVQDGCYLMKIRTEGDWDESPDFGRCGGTEEDCQVQVPDDGTAVGEEICEASGEGTAIGQIEFLDTGSYEFAYVEPEEMLEIRRLTEVGAIAGTVSFPARGGGLPEATVSVRTAGTGNEVTSVTSSPADGAFLAEGLTPGTYDVLVQAAGFVEQLIESVSVFAFETTEVGNVALEVGCTSLFSRVQLVGDFNSWDESASSDMTQVSECVWSKTVDVTIACSLIKFRTNGAWGNDFGRCADVEVSCPASEFTVPGDGTLLVASSCNAADPLAVGSIAFPGPGSYEFILNEGSGEFTVRNVGGPAPTGSLAGTVSFSDGPGTLPVATISVRPSGSTTEVASTTSDPSDGTWQVTDLPAGDYDLVFSAPNYLSSSVTTTVTPPGETTVPVVTLDRVPVGSISGTVGFSDSPSSRPLASITAYEAGTTTVAGGAVASQVDGTFAITNLTPGAYDLLFRADSYMDSTITDIDVVALANTAVPLVTLEFECATTVQIVGDFNSWNSAAPFMTPSGPCAWSQDLAIPAGCYRLKLRTNGDWDETPDYGRCSGDVGSCQVLVPDTGAPVLANVCKGVGLSDALGELNFENGGTYSFQFDEQNGRLFIRRIGP